MFQILVYGILLLSRCDAVPQWLFDDIQATAEYLTALYSIHGSDPGARTILYHVTAALKFDFFSKELAFNQVPIIFDNVADEFWQINPELFDLSNQHPRVKKRFTRAESDLIREIRLKLPDPPELIPCEPNQPDLDPIQYRNYKPLIVESAILKYAYSMNRNHEVAQCVDRIKRRLRHLDPYRYIYYESLELYRLFTRVYRNHQNPIAIIVLKLLFNDIDNFIKRASEDLISENLMDQRSLNAALVNVDWCWLRVTRIIKNDIRQAEEPVRSVLADVSRGLQLFELTKYDKPSVANYSIATRHYLQQQCTRIPVVDIVSSYPRVRWDRDSQTAFQHLMNRVLAVENNSSV